MPERIAIVGSGVSGLSALWALNRAGHEVHLYESSNCIGGHAYSFPWRNSAREGDHTMVDIAFVLFNTTTYPNFVSFLSHVGIDTSPVRVSFGMTRDNGAMEWSSKSLSGLFSQRRNLFSPRMYRFIFDLIRFNMSATEVLQPGYEFEKESIGSYLTRNGYSDAFTNDYLIPLSSSIWVYDPDKTAQEMPAVMLIRYLWNHHMLNTFTSALQWLSIKGGCYQYVEHILQQVPKEQVHVSTKVMQVCKDGDHVNVVLEDGSVESYDRVIIATHAPDALRLRGADASVEERSILGTFRTTSSKVVVHSDTSFMPQRREAWSAWNYIDRSPTTSSALLPSSEKPNAKRVSLSFHMNEIINQQGSSTSPILTTLNPPWPPRPDTVQGTFSYSHPAYDNETLREQERMPIIQGTHNIWYAGAWMRYGFHEDGFTAGLEAARGIDPMLKLPFPIRDWRRSRGSPVETKTSTTMFARFLIMLLQAVILRLVFLWNLVPIGRTRQRPGQIRL